MLRHSTDHLGDAGDQGILRPLLWPGTAACHAGRALRSLSEVGHPRADEEPDFPVRVLAALLRHVFPGALEHLSDVRGFAGPASGGHPAADLQAALAVGLP